MAAGPAWATASLAPTALASCADICGGAACGSVARKLLPADVGDAAGVVTTAPSAEARLRLDLDLGDREGRDDRALVDVDASSSDEAPSDFLDEAEPLDGLRRRVRRALLGVRPDARERLPRRDTARFLLLPFHA